MKMIVLDLDGTLLDSNETIMPKTKEILLKLQEEGIKVVLASGRNFNNMKRFGDELLLDKYEGYYIQVNGISITNAKTLETTSSGRLTVDEAKEIFDTIRPLDYEIQVIREDSIYTYIPKHKYPIKEEYRKLHNIGKEVNYRSGAHKLNVHNNLGYLNTIYINDVDDIHTEVNKVTIADDEYKIDNALLVLTNKFKDKYWIGKTSPRWLEVLNKEVYKGNALKKLLDKLDIDKEDVVAFGDGENDLEMIKLVGKGIVMGNALDSVRKQAYYITSSNNDEGIYKALIKIREGEI